MTAQQITTFALAQLSLAPENARYGVEYDEADLADLATSIRSPLGMLDPLKAYSTEDGAAVWDGGRRLAALQLIAQDGTDASAAIVGAVSVILTTREEARLASVATFLRKEMHPAQRFATYNQLFEDGRTVQEIAAACAVSEKGVAQLLRFRMLDPGIFATFREGGMDLDAAFAFTLTDVHEDQLAVLASFNGKAPRAHEVRDRLRKNSINASDKKARYVGREAYAAAGGRFLTDLFSNREIDETWQDAVLLDRLYHQKLDGQIAELEAEGWGQVIVTNDSYGWEKGYVTMAPEGQGKKKGFTEEQMTGGVAFIQFGWQGQVKVLRGYRKAAKATGANAAAVPLSKREPARYGFGHAGHEKLTLVATRATQLALVQRPDVAYDGVVQHMAWQALYVTTDGVSKLVVPYDYKSPRPQAALAEALDAWKDRLPSDRPNFCEAVAALSPDEKAQLLALSFAVTLDAVEPKTDYRKPDRWAHLGWLARAAEVDFKAAWTPDEEFLNRGNRDALEAAVAEIAPRELEAMRKAKKGVLVAFTAQKVEQTGWVPQLLRELVAAPAKPKAAKKPAKAAPVAAETPSGDE